MLGTILMIVIVLNSQNSYRNVNETPMTKKETKQSSYIYTQTYVLVYEIEFYIFVNTYRYAFSMCDPKTKQQSIKRAKSTYDRF